MASDVIDFGEHKRRKKMRPFGPLRGRYSRPFGQMPIAIMRIYQLMLDAPEDPPLAKLAWMLSYFGEVSLPDGNTYRLERGRLEEREGEAWICSTSNVRRPRPIYAWIDAVAMATDRQRICAKASGLFARSMGYPSAA